MKRILYTSCAALIVLVALLPLLSVRGSVSSGMIWEINANATGSNVNGGGFNPQNPNFATDMAATSATGSAAVLNPTSYAFVANDVTVGAWVFIKTSGAFGASETGSYGCWWQIASQSSGDATVNSGVGQGVCMFVALGYPTPRFIANTTAGIANTASPSGGTWGLDYSQGTTAGVALTDLLVGAIPTEVTSALNPVGPHWIGNILHLNSGSGCTATTTAWLEVVSVATITATLDTTAGTAASVCVAKLGGAMSLNSTLDDDLFEKSVAGNRWFIKNAGSPTLGEAVALSATGIAVIEGYNSLRGDMPTGSTRPLLNVAALGMTLTVNWDIYFVQIIGSAANNLALGTGSKAVDVKSTNISTTTTRTGFLLNTDAWCFRCEGISYRGRGISMGNTIAHVYGAYAHDSDVGIYSSSTGNPQTVMFSIVAANVSRAIHIAGANVGGTLVSNSTLYGGSGTKTGIGIDLTSGTTDFRALNNIIYGFTTGINHADTSQISGWGACNDLNNNTTNYTGWAASYNSVTVDPQFTSVSQLTGATATTTSGNHLVQSGATFVTSGVTAGRDFLYVVSGTGVTAGVHGIASVDSETQVTTDITLAANATADKVWQIVVGRNFAVGTNVKALGCPGLFPGGLSTGYLDIGAVQRQEAGGGGGQKAVAR